MWAKKGMDVRTPTVRAGEGGQGARAGGAGHGGERGRASCCGGGGEGGQVHRVVEPVVEAMLGDVLWMYVCVSV